MMGFLCVLPSPGASAKLKQVVEKLITRRSHLKWGLQFKIEGQRMARVQK